MKYLYHCFAILMMAILAKDASGQDFTTASEVLEANLEATGGRAAWEAVKTIKRTGTRELDMSMGTRQSTFTTHNKYPGFSRTDETINSEMGSMEQLIVTTPEGRWTTSRAGRRELPARDWISTEYAKDELFLLTDDRVKLLDLTTDVGDGGPEYIVSFEFEGETYQRKYNKFTLYLTAAEAPGNDGKKNWSTFDDYRDMDGFKTPFIWESVATVTMNRNGNVSTDQISILTELGTIVFNEEISDDLFASE